MKDSRWSRQSDGRWGGFTPECLTGCWGVPGPSAVHIKVYRGQRTTPVQSLSPEAPHGSSGQGSGWFSIRWVRTPQLVDTVQTCWIIKSEMHQQGLHSQQNQEDPKGSTVIINMPLTRHLLYCLRIIAFQHIVCEKKRKITWKTRHVLVFGKTFKVMLLVNRAQYKKRLCQFIHQHVSKKMLSCEGVCWATHSYNQTITEVFVFSPTVSRFGHNGKKTFHPLNFNLLCSSVPLLLLGAVCFTLW